MNLRNVVFLLLLRILVANDLNFSTNKSNITNINNLEEISPNNENSFGVYFLMIILTISNL